MFHRERMNPFDNADSQAATNPPPDASSSAAKDTLAWPSQEDPCSLTGGHDLIVQLVQPRTPASVRAVRHLVGEALSALAVNYTCRVDIEIALGEVCTNAVLHAGGTGYRVAVRIKDNNCVIEVVDDGIGIGLAPSPEGPETTPRPGQGLFLVAALVDEWEIKRREPTGTVVRMAKRLARAEPTN
jgi:serine/threonine-protein kinase RsbW